MVLLTLTAHALSSILGTHAKWTHFLVSQELGQCCSSSQEHNDMYADASRA
jgi:hypothetical protein